MASDVARLRVQVHEGRGFNVVRSFYCTLCLGQLQKFKTSDCTKKSSNPKWDNPQMFEFGISDMKGEVVLQCWETKKSKVFGELTIPLSNFGNNEQMQVDRWFKLKSTTSSSNIGELRLGLQYTALKRPRKGSTSDKPLANTQSNIDKLKLLANLPRGPPTIYEMIEHNIMEEYAFLHAELDRLEEKHGRDSAESQPVGALLEVLQKKSKEFHLVSLHHLKETSAEAGPQLARLIEQLSSSDEQVQEKALSSILNDHLKHDDGSESREIAGGKGITPLVALTSSPKLRTMALASLAIITKYLVNVDELESHIFSVASGISDLSQSEDLEAAGVTIANIFGNNVKVQERVLVQGDHGVVAQSFSRLLPTCSENLKSHLLWALNQLAIQEDKLSSENQGRALDFLLSLIPAVHLCLKDSSTQVQEMAISALCGFHTATNFFAKSPKLHEIFPSLLALLSSDKESVVIQTLKTVANFATEVTIREAFFDAEEPVVQLVSSLSHPNAEIQLYAAWAIANVADLSLSEISAHFVEVGGIPALLKILNSPRDDVKLKSLLALSNLANLPKAVEIIGTSMDVLVQLLNTSKALVRIEVLRLFAVLTASEQGRQVILDNNALHPILQQLSHSDTRSHEVKDQVLWTLCRLSANDKAREQIRDEKGFYPLMTLLNTSYSLIHEPLLRLVFLLVSTSEKSKQEFTELGGIPALVTIFSKSEGNVRKLCKCIMTSLSKTDKYRKLVAECIVLNLRIQRK